MSFLSRLFGRETKASAVAPIVAAASRLTASWSKRDYENFAEEAYVRNAIAYRCIRMVAGGAAGVPFIAYAGDKELDDHPILQLLKNPSPLQGGASLFEQFFSYLLISGNGYMEAVGPNNGPPTELWTLRPDRMTVIPGDYGLPQAYEYSINSRKKRWEMDPIRGKGPIFHLKEFNPTDDWYGLSRVEASSFGVDRHNAASMHNKALLDNGARPAGALVFKPMKGEDGEGDVIAPQPVIDAAEERLMQRHGGPANAGKPMVFGGMVDWVEMGTSPRDMDFNESKNDAARDICTAFGVPHLLMVPGSATYNNVKEAKLELWEETVLPLLDKALDGLNAWLSPMFGDNIRLDVDLDQISALEPRREIRRTSTVLLLEKNVITVEEARDALQYGKLDPNAIRKIDATILKALLDAIPKLGYEPLLKYCKSVGLFEEGLTVEQLVSNVEALVEEDGDDSDAGASLVDSNDTDDSENDENEDENVESDEGA